MVGQTPVVCAGPPGAAGRQRIQLYLNQAKPTRASAAVPGDRPTLIQIAQDRENYMTLRTLACHSRAHIHTIMLEPAAKFSKSIRPYYAAALCPALTAAPITPFTSLDGTTSKT